MGIHHDDEEHQERNGFREVILYSKIFSSNSLHVVLELFNRMSWLWYDRIFSIDNTQNNFKFELAEFFIEFFPQKTSLSQSFSYNPQLAWSLVGLESLQM